MASPLATLCTCRGKREPRECPQRHSQNDIQHWRRHHQPMSAMALMTQSKVQKILFILSRRDFLAAESLIQVHDHFYLFCNLQIPTT